MKDFTQQLSPPTEGLIKQELLSYVQRDNGTIVIHSAIRNYYADEKGNVKLDDYHDTTSSSPLSLWSGHPTSDDMRKEK